MSGGRRARKFWPYGSNPSRSASRERSDVGCECAVADDTHRRKRIGHHRPDKATGQPPPAPRWLREHTDISGEAAPVRHVPRSDDPIVLPKHPEPSRLGIRRAQNPREAALGPVGEMIPIEKREQRGLVTVNRLRRVVCRAQEGPCVGVAVP